MITRLVKLMILVSVIVAGWVETGAAQEAEEAAGSLGFHVLDMAKSNKLEDLSTVFRIAHELTGDPQLLFQRGRILEARRDFVAARSVYTAYGRLIADDPALVKALGKRLKAVLNEKVDKNAFDPIQAAEAIGNAMLAEIRKGSNENAYRIISRANELHPVNHSLLIPMAWLLLRMSKPEAALCKYKRYLDIEREDERSIALARKNADILIGEVGGGLTCFEGEPVFTGLLKVLCDCEDADVILDGRNAGKVRKEGFNVVVGHHTVRVVRDNATSPVEPVVIARNETTSPRLRIPGCEKAAGTEGVKPVVVSPGSGGARSAPVPVAAVKTTGGRFPWHWVCIGTGAAILAGGGVLTWMGNSDWSKLKNAGKEDVPGVGEVVTGINQRRASSLESSANRKWLASYVMYGTGAAAVLTGVILWVASPSRHPTSGPPVTFSPLPGGAVVSGMARF